MSMLEKQIWDIKSWNINVKLSASKFIGLEISK